MTEKLMLITPEAALALLEQLMPDSKLNPVQENILRYSLQRLTYREMAKILGYDASHIRDLAYPLWQRLSQVLGEKVTKKSVAPVLRRAEALQKSRLQRTSNPETTNSDSASVLF